MMPLPALFPALTSIPGSLGSSSGAGGGPITTNISTGGLNPPARASDPLPLLGLGALIVVVALVLKKGRK